MALHLDLTGLFPGDRGHGGLTRAGFEAAFPRAHAAREAHLQAIPIWQNLHSEERHFLACQARAEAVRQQGAEACVVLGIGGSALGASACLGALAPIYPGLAKNATHPRVFVIDSLDPDWIGEFLKAVPAETCHFNVVSKSGGTLETSSQFLVFYEAVRKVLGDDAATRARFTLTTDVQHGHFRKLADEVGFETLEVPDGVGGRFSVLSPVGLFPLLVGGVDVEGLLAGAAKSDENLRATEAASDPALAYALAHVLHLEQGRNVHVQFPYSHRLRLATEWFQQLWAESLGKRVNRAGEVVHTGGTPVKAVGPTDQHSQVQLYVEGPDDKVYTMLRLDRFEREVKVPEPFVRSKAFDHVGGRALSDLMEAERHGTEHALLEAGRPVCSIELCKLDAFHLGQLFLFYEVATAYAGGLLGIDPYDQPGVEAGKIAALALMGCAGFEEQAQRIRSAMDARTPFRLSC